MTAPPNLAEDISKHSDDDEVSLFNLLIALSKQWKLILGLPLFAAIISIVYSLSLNPIYTADIRLLPPQGSQSASALLGQLGGVGAMLGAGLKGSNDVYVAMLKSRTLADKLIQRFGLIKRYGIDEVHPSDAYIALKGVTNVTVAKDGLILIEVDDQDPKFAAELANAYADELDKLSGVLAVTEASQRRLFFERQFAQARDNLAKAEAEARQALLTGGLVRVEDQGSSLAAAATQLRSQILAKAVLIGGMRNFAADRNPDLQRAEQELDVLKRELTKIEGVSETKHTTSPPTGSGAESLRLLRIVKEQAYVVDLLAKQYEMAKIEEAKDSSILQVLDKAIEPTRKSKPKRAVIVLIWTTVAGFIALLLSFIRITIASTSSDPQRWGRFKAFKRRLVGR
jgi:tyrosine-protein kinase Etk/Wzc